VITETKTTVTEPRIVTTTQPTVIAPSVVTRPTIVTQPNVVTRTPPPADTTYVNSTDVGTTGMATCWYDQLGRMICN
jgi:hypothetical protein